MMVRCTAIQSRARPRRRAAVSSLLDWKSRAPFAAENHPTDEHLMPIFFALGAAGKHPRGERTHASRQFGFFAFDSYLFH
jgi:4,5-DOPA dioxygenase extradiol